MCTVKHVLIKKNIYIQIGLTWVCHFSEWVESAVHGVKAIWLSGKDTGPHETVSKEGHADCLLRHERTHDYWFLWKKSRL